MSTASELLTLGSRYRTVQSNGGIIPLVTADAGTTKSVELPRSFLIKRLWVRITGSIVVGAVNGVAVAPEAPLPLFPKVEVIADGRKTIVALAARDLYRAGHLFHGKASELSPPPSPNIGTQAFAVSFPIDFQAQRMGLPLDSYFDPRPYEKVELKFTLGQFTDVIQTGAGTTYAFGAGTQIEFQVDQTTQGAPNVIANRLQFFDEIGVVATSSQFIQNVPRAGLLAGILFRTTRQVAGGPTVQLADNIINRISLKSDNNFLHADSLGWSALQRRNVQDYDLDSFLAAASNMGQQIPGYAYLDLTEDGLLSSALNTFDLNVLQLLLDITRTSDTELIRASYIFFEPIQGR